MTTDQMRRVDHLMVEAYGISLLQMMENAGRHLAARAVPARAPEHWPDRRQSGRQKLRSAVEAHVFAHGQLTACNGVISSQVVSEVDNLLVMADEALFRAKHAGRNSNALQAMANRAPYQAKRNSRNHVSVWHAGLAELPRQTSTATACPYADLLLVRPCACSSGA